MAWRTTTPGMLRASRPSEASGGAGPGAAEEPAAAAGEGGRPRGAPLGVARPSPVRPGPWPRRQRSGWGRCVREGLRGVSGGSGGDERGLWGLSGGGCGMS